MSSFIHGEVNWQESPEVVARNVGLMMEPVASYPWSGADTFNLSGPGVACVVAVQRGANSSNPVRVADNGSNSISVIADLQIHGREELEDQLDVARHGDAEIPAEELVFHAYRKWGLACAERVIGEGTFAIWDASEQRLICWRDAAGVRPFYFYHVPGRQLLFSSDLQSLLAHSSVPRRFDLPYMRSFLGGELFQHPERTLIQDVRKLRAASVLTFDRNGLRIRCYWNAEEVTYKARGTEEDQIAELRSLLRTAIGDRIRSSATAVGAHLSGGLDSSSIAVLAADRLGESGQTLRAFSWAPPRDTVPSLEEDERDLVDAVAQANNLTVEYTDLQPADLFGLAYRDAALRPRVSLQIEVGTSKQAVASGVRTILSGWGGDEGIAINGRGYFAELAIKGRFATIQRELTLKRRLHNSSVVRDWRSRVGVPLLPDWAVRYPPGAVPPIPGEIRPDFAALLAEVEPLQHAYPRERPGVRRMQGSLLRFGHLESRMEAWASHGATLGLAYSFPLLDRRILEFALGLPARMFFRDGWKRWLYRTAMDGILPDAVRWNRRKFDSAAEVQLRELMKAPSDLYRDVLLDRRNNALIDVDVILAARSRYRESGTRTENVGGAVWLAFTCLQP